jgi:hypothetical protein
MRGRPFPPGNHSGKGRPKGSRNKKTLLAQEIVDSRGEAVLDQAFDLAEKGDPQMIRTLLPYLMRSKEATFNLGPLPIGTVTDLAQSSEKVLSKVASGEITITDAGKVLDMIEQRRKILETQDIERRLRAIERNTVERDAGRNS